MSNTHKKPAPNLEPFVVSVAASFRAALEDLPRATLRQVAEALSEDPATVTMSLDQYGVTFSGAFQKPVPGSNRPVVKFVPWSEVLN